MTLVFGIYDAFIIIESKVQKKAQVYATVFSITAIGKINYCEVMQSITPFGV